MRKISTILGLLLAFSSFASGMEDFMYSNEKIFVVVGVLVIIFIVLASYLFRLDRKVKKLEQRDEA